MKNQDTDYSNKRSPVISEKAVTADVAEADLVLEFFSGAQGKWIPVEIIDRNDSGAVQVCAKPGVWLSAKDCKRKLRARVYADDPTIGSTIRPADAFLNSKAESPKGPPTSLGPRAPAPAPAASRRNYAASPVGRDEQSAAKSVSAQKPLSVKQSMISGGRIATATGIENQKVQSLRSVNSKPTAPQQLDIHRAEVSNSRNSCDTPKSDTTQEPSPKSRVAPDPSSFQPVRQSTGPPPQGHSCFNCPRCGATDLPTFESAVQHCPAPDQVDKPTSSAGNTSPFDNTDLPPGYKAGRQRNGLRFVVGTVPVAIQKAQDDKEAAEVSPVEGSWSIPTAPVSEEVKGARDRYQPSPLEGNGDVGGETDSTRSSEGRGPAARPQQPEPPTIEGPNGTLRPPAVGEAIAYNIRGEPIITRAVSSDTGAGVTTVVNEDGTKCTFGKNTLASLMSSDETDATSWIGSLSTLETRGLVHEIGQVLLSTSQIYQFHLDRLKALREKSHYSFFGLSEDATDADVDRAYKKLAKQMHPDKNGGTDEAKERFQQMKERYEALKARRAEENGDEPKRRKSSKSDSDDGEKDDTDKEGESKEERRKEAYDEDDEDEAPKQKESGQISYDPTDQTSLASTALEMLQRLKAIEGSMSTVLGQLKMGGL